MKSMVCIGLERDRLVGNRALRRGGDVISLRGVGVHGLPQEVTKVL